MLTEPLLAKLRTLKLSGMLLTLDTRSAQAVAGNLTPPVLLRKDWPCCLTMNWSEGERTNSSGA